ncbi:hypothetical protein D3C73_1367510 [compost metagenome]
MAALYRELPRDDLRIHMVWQSVGIYSRELRGLAAPVRSGQPDSKPVLYSCFAAAALSPERTKGESGT